MPPRSPEYIYGVFDILAQREGTRWALALGRRDIPEQKFYAVDNSLRHKSHNRYSNVLAFDRTSVSVEGKYLNANVVTDGKGGTWIAAQAPPPLAFDTFFQAIYHGSATGKRKNNAIVVQLTGWEERGRIKADPYMNHAMEHLPLKIAKQKRQESIASTVTELLLGDNEPMTIHHYHFDSWPDHGVPEGPGVEALRNLVEEVQQRRDSLDCEVWVHWTGTFIALSSLRQPGQASSPSHISSLSPDLLDDPVATTVDVIRESRAMLVQTSEQLKLIYEMQ